MLSGMLLAACNQVPGKDFYADRMDKISSIEVLLKTVTQVAGKEEPIEHQKIGNGFVVGNYVFSRDHVTSKHYLNKLQSPYGVVKVEFQNPVLSEQTFLDDLVLHSVYENIEDDVAIFDLSKQPELCEKYCNDLTLDDLMTSDELYQGMRVYYNASPGGKRSGYYKESHITKLRDEADIGTSAENSFMIQEIIIPGTSGKPLWSDSKIIGATHYVWNHMGGFGFMDKYIEEIEKYEKR